jgi:hypothetical protein
VEKYSNIEIQEQMEKKLKISTFDYVRIKPSHVLSSSLYYELALSDLQFIQNYNKDNNLAIKPSTFENLI